MSGEIRPLMVLTASDGSSLVLGDLPGGPERLMFQHGRHGAAESVHGAMAVFWVTIADHRHVVFVGDGLDVPDVDRVSLDFPHHTESCRVLRSPKSGRLLWMSFPQPFRPFETPLAEPSVPPGAVVTATWLTRDGRVMHEERTPPLEWGITYPVIPPPPPEYPEVPSPDEFPRGWTRYSPVDG